jgi:gamma-glutamyltranspeptidase/glutathione hydrolase
MLEAGGNAFDAVVAAGFASTVCEPGFTSLAGGGFLLARTPDGRSVVHDFFVDTPGRGRPTAGAEPIFEEQRFHCGPGSVAVPGTLAGLLHVHARLGTLPLARVVAPAAALASDGVVVTPSQGADLALLEPILSRTAASRAVYCPHGPVLAEGDVLRNPDLGAFLRQLGDDPSATFYRGHGATQLVDQLDAGGSALTLADLAAYRVIEREPLPFTYRGRCLLTNPPPSFGGALLAIALARFEAAGTPAPAGSAALAAALVAVMASVDADRDAHHPELMAALRTGPVDDPGTRPVAARGTTHVTVADELGNVASMTASNGECSGDVIAGTGISCNNMLGEDDLHPNGFHAAEAGVRVASMMSPTFVLGTGGAVELALGSGGSKRIRSALLQVLVAVLDHDTALADAIDAPRLHWDTDHVEIEPGWSAEVLTALEAGAPVNRWPHRSMYFGGVHAVAPGRTAAGDARRGGTTRTV